MQYEFLFRKLTAMFTLTSIIKHRYSGSASVGTTCGQHEEKIPEMSDIKWNKTDARLEWMAARTTWWEGRRLRTSVQTWLTSRFRMGCPERYIMVTFWDLLVSKSLKKTHLNKKTGNMVYLSFQETPVNMKLNILKTISLKIVLSFFRVDWGEYFCWCLGGDGRTKQDLVQQAITQPTQCVASALAQCLYICVSWVGHDRHQPDRYGGNVDPMPG